MRQRWVDGFNVIHCLPELASMAADDNEACRRAFLRLLAPLVYGSGERWTVIFDAPRPGRARAPGPIEVVYALDADAWIVARLEKERHADAVTVVSSDEKDIGRRARALGAKVLPAAVLVRALQGEDAPEFIEPEKPEHVSPEEVDFWLDAFGAGGSSEPWARSDTFESEREDDEQDL